MKRIFTQLLSILTLLFIFIFPTYASDTYTFDPNHTYVQWHINHFGFSNPSGKWMAQGTLILNQANPQNSKVSVTINTADITTGIKDLDEHLQSPLFFDTVKYPKATFVSDKVDVTGKNTAKVHGILTVHGISKPITLDVTLNKIGINPITDKNTVGFSGHAELNRSDFGINTLIPGISDDVKINIEAEAAQQ